jgi:hypothetical protein
MTHPDEVDEDRVSTSIIKATTALVAVAVLFAIGLWAVEAGDDRISPAPWSATASHVVPHQVRCLA